MFLAWEDPRIIVRPNATMENSWILDEVGYDLPKEFTKNLWLPVAYIEKVHKITKFNLIRDYESVSYWLNGDMPALIYQNEVEMFVKLVVLYQQVLCSQYISLYEIVCFFELVLFEYYVIEFGEIGTTNKRNRQFIVFYYKLAQLCFNKLTID